MFKKTQIILSTIVVLLSYSVSAQKMIKKAEMQFENGEFQNAVQSYKNHLEEQPSDFNTTAKLAECYVAMGQKIEAIHLFESIPQQASVEPIHYRKYGELLKTMGRYDDANAVFKLYGNFDKIEADQCIASCEYSKKILGEKPSYEIFVMPSNSSASDFGLTFYKDLPVFSSFRDDVLMTETERELNPQGNAHRTFLYNQKKNRLGFIRDMDGSLNHVGPVSFSANGATCAIILSKLQDDYCYDISKKASSLHIGTVNDRGEITSSKPFVYNEVGSSINAAQMAFDGTAIYFSSDRNGGFGGFDIYVSYFQNGSWSLPQNLGDNINSPGNEISPYLKGKELYFASDYHMGMGGYDIFKSEVIAGNWNLPTNLGYGANSMNDDYFPCFNSLGELYLTSNRLGGKGGNDIYKTLKTKDEQEPELSFIPPAVSLDDLAAETQKHTINDHAATSVSLVESGSKSHKSEVAFSLPEFDAKKVGTNASADLSLEGAHRIGVDEIIPTTEVFFIQLASMSSSKPNFGRFKTLIKYGNIYKMYNDKAIKVRLGYFTDRKEAEEILTKVKANGYKDAFITYEILNTAQMELVLSSSDEHSFTDEGNFNTKSATKEMRDFKLGSKYKVRLASYEDPIWFDINKVKDLGRIEQWTKGGWTIFILAGYNDLDEAKAANIQAINRGYKTAEVVIDNGGILERLKNN